MIADIARNEAFPLGLVPYAPYVWLGLTARWELPTAWPNAWGDTLATATGRRKKVIQVSHDFIDKYSRQDTLNDCLTQEASFYFDAVNHQVYVHILHTDTPYTASIDYGWGFGVCDIGFKYVDDYEYLPLISSNPSIDREADGVKQSRPKGIAGSVQLDNVATVNPLTAAIEGPLDWMISESVYGNDVVVYNNSGVEQFTAYIDDVGLSTESVSLNLESRRFV